MSFPRLVHLRGGKDRQINLTPNEAKRIGAYVSNNDHAHVLIENFKHPTMRRVSVTDYIGMKPASALPPEKQAYLRQFIMFGI